MILRLLKILGKRLTKPQMLLELNFIYSETTYLFGLFDIVPKRTQNL